MAANISQGRRFGWWLWLGGYVAMVSVVAWALLYARGWALENLTSSQSAQDWQAWRNDAGTMPGRRPPKSAEPPGLVLMRDNFAVCLIGALLFTSLLYGVIAWFVTGMLRARPT